MRKKRTAVVYYGSRIKCIFSARFDLRKKMAKIVYRTPALSLSPICMPTISAFCFYCACDRCLYLWTHKSLRLQFFLSLSVQTVPYTEPLITALDYNFLIGDILIIFVLLFFDWWYCYKKRHKKNQHTYTVNFDARQSLKIASVLKSNDKVKNKKNVNDAFTCPECSCEFDFNLSDYY